MKKILLSAVIMGILSPLGALKAVEFDKFGKTELNKAAFCLQVESDIKKIKSLNDKYKNYSEKFNDSDYYEDFLDIYTTSSYTYDGLGRLAEEICGLDVE